MAHVVNKERVYDRCAFKNCTNGRHSTQSHLYRFPRFDDPRYDVWIQHTGNPRLKTWAAATLRNAGLCASHFHESCFQKDGKLKRDAVPLPFHWAKNKRMEGVTELNNSFVSTSFSSITSSSISIESHYDNLDEEEPTHESEVKYTQPDETIGAKILNPFVSNERSCPVHTYSKRPLSFSDSDDESMAWTAIEPALPELSENLEEQLRTEVDLWMENRKLRRLNTALRVQITGYRRQVRELRVRLRRAVNRNNSLQKKSKAQTVSQFLDENNCIEPAARAMVKLQLHRKNAPFADDEKDLAKQLYYYSAAGYKRLRKAGCTFPSESTVRLWIADIEIQPGFCHDIFVKLKAKLAELPPDERICCLKWDEMTIKNFEEYSVKFDCIEGLVDLGPLGRRNERARYVFAFCLDSINARNPWRQPIAYFLTGNGMKATEINELLQQCLKKLNDAGAQVVLVTCDQGPSNQSLFSSLLGVTKSTPSFHCAGREYFASFDFPHLMKRLVSMLRTHRYLYCDGKVIAAYDDFINTWKHDCSNTTSRLLGHITESHLFPSSFEAMNVKRAFQLLSHTFSAAILTAGHDPNGLSSATWKDTAAFAERMNTVIDACNAYELLFRNPAKRPLSDRNPGIEKTLIDFVHWSSKWAVARNNTASFIGNSSGVVPTLKKIPCLNGIPLTVTSIIKTYYSVKKEYPGFELAAALCNQDSVEHFFSKLRQRGGFNPNPTARMVRLTFRHILSTGYIGTSDRGNVQCPEAVALLNPTSIVTKAFERTDDLPVNPIEHDEEGLNVDVTEASGVIEYYDTETRHDDISTSDIVSYEKNAITFFAGYIAHRSIKKNPCECCRDEILKTPMDDSSPDEMYIEYREYDNIDEDAPKVTKLKRPTRKFAAIVEAQLRAYCELWQRHWHTKGVLDKLTHDIVTSTAPMYSEWCDNSHQCRDHRLQQLQFLIRVKLFAQTKYNNRAAQASTAMRKTQKPNKKLRKLQGL